MYVVAAGPEASIIGPQFPGPALPPLGLDPLLLLGNTVGIDNSSSPHPSPAQKPSRHLFSSGPPTTQSPRSIPSQQLPPYQAGRLLPTTFTMVFLAYSRSWWHYVSFRVVPVSPLDSKPSDGQWVLYLCALAWRQVQSTGGMLVWWRGHLYFRANISLSTEYMRNIFERFQWQFIWNTAIRIYIDKKK